MQPNIYENTLHSQRDDHDFHEKCRKHLYQIVQIELHDGSVYQGLLHSFDKDKLFLIMPSSTHKPHVSMHTHDDESRLFPFFGPFGLFGFPFFGIRRFGPFFPFFFI